MSGICNLVVVDIQRKARTFWKAVVPIIQASDNREVCAFQLTTWIFNNRDEYQTGKCTNCDQETFLLQYLGWFLKRDTSWMFDEKRFKRIKKIFDSNHFVYLNLDLTDTKQCAALADTLKTQGCQLDLAYLSNVSECIPKENYEQLAQSLEVLLPTGTLVVDTAARAFKTTETLAKIVPSLFQTILSSYDGEVPSLEQRVTVFSSVEELLPIVAVQRKLQQEESETLFYHYGLQQQYYSREDTKDAERKVKFLEDNPSFANYLSSLQEIENT